MKRLLLSIAISFLLVTAYMTVSTIIFILSGQNIALVSYLDLPIKLPRILFYYFYQPSAEDFSTDFYVRQMFLDLFSFIANVLLYPIPVYILLTVFSRTRRKVELTQTEPPLPPSFAS